MFGSKKTSSKYTGSTPPNARIRSHKTAPLAEAITESVAAAEAAIGLAILIVLFRTRRSINVQDLDRLKG